MFLVIWRTLKFCRQHFLYSWLHGVTVVYRGLQGSAHFEMVGIQEFYLSCWKAVFSLSFLSIAAKTRMENIVEDSPFLFESSKCCLGSKRRCIPYQYSCLLIFCGFSSSDSLWSRPFCDDGTCRKTRNFSFVNEYFCSHGMDRRWDVYGIGTGQEMIRSRSSEI